MSWNSWLDEIVEWDQNEYIKRRLAIHKLCKYGLIPFLESHGYSVAVDHKEQQLHLKEQSPQQPSNPRRWSPPAPHQDPHNGCY